MHIDNKQKDILIVSKTPTQGLDGTAFTAEALYPIKVYQFKAKNSKIKDYALCLGNVSKDFTINKIIKKTRLDILDIHRYLMKRT